MKKIVLFGDSITAGYLNHQNTDIVDTLTAKHLADMGFPGYSFVNLGVNGNTSADDGMARLAEATAEARDAEFVVVFLGDNDAANQTVSAEEYQKNLTQIVAELGAEKVVLVGPSYIKTVAEDVLTQYVEAARAIGETTLSFIDLHHYFLAYPGHEQFLDADGLHFSEEGYDFFTALIARDIKEYLLAQAS